MNSFADPLAVAPPETADSSLDSSLLERARRADAALVQRCRAGEERAWGELVERFSSYVYAIASRFVRGEDRVQDVYQEVFMRVYTRLDSLRDDEALRPWIAQLTRRAAIDRLRADAREQPAGEAAETVSVPELNDIESALTVRRALEELPPPFGEVLRRFFIEDESYRTIGAALGLPSGTVASRISRGLSLLRAVLEDGPATGV
jgi:RNA polymerase sigma factor (sigma-70 family)